MRHVLMNFVHPDDVERFARLGVCGRPVIEATRGSQAASGMSQLRKLSRLVSQLLFVRS